jgi:serine/threonine protein kinase/tetratricopeptide (TPR) repeat protein
MSLAAGTRLGPYEIVAPIGAGGMGEVYKARDSRLDRDVAIKVIGRGAASDPTSRQRLQREARAASALNHPHICTIYDVGDADGRPFIAMEWIDGESLADRLAGARTERLGLNDVLRLASQIADGLDAAHASGIIHRDLKPANLFITKRGDAKILDFGLAKVSAGSGETMAPDPQLTSPGAAVGTVAYMSPEQARGEALAPTSDLFSLGVVLYEMATGRPAFAGPTTAITFDAILNRQPPSPRAIRPDVPPALEQIITRLLDKHPSARHQSARAVYDEIDALRTGAARGSSSRSTRIVPSLAVLPFTNLSPEADNEFIADGITEEIISTLAQIRGMQVAARTSSFAFKGRTPDLAEVAAKLRVAHVVTGSVRKAGGKLRISAQLVNTRDGFTIWSDRYDRTIDDIFAIQDEIAVAIAEKLRIALTGSESPLGKRPTDNLAAYELYLKGNFLVNQRGTAMTRGLEAYQQALALDPDYALAHTGIAKATVLLGFYGYQPSYEAMPKARSIARKAIDLDPSLAEPHVWLSAVLWLHEWDFTEAERETGRALALDARTTSAYGMHALHMAAAHGRFDESFEAGRRVIELDPLSPAVLALISSCYLCAAKYDECVNLARRALELDPHLWTAERFLGTALGQMGRTEESIAHLQHAVDASGRHHWPMQELAAVLTMIDRIAEAERLSDELIERSRTRYVPPSTMAALFSLTGKTDEAFEWLERAYREHDTLPIFRRWPYAVGSTEPRLASMFARMGL